MPRARGSRPREGRLRDLLPSALAQGALSHPEVTRDLLGEGRECALPSPLLPPRAGHLALLLASGALTGLVVTDSRGHRLLLRGSTCKTDRVHRDDGEERREEVFAVAVDALDLDDRGRLHISGAASADSIIDFFAEIRDSLARAAASTLSPVISSPPQEELPSLVREPLGMQAPAIAALAHAIRQLGSALVVGEQGCGKTYISLAAAYAAGCRRLLVLCPPHLASKWARETRMTIPGATAIVCRRLSDLERGRDLAQRGRPVVCVLPREHARLHYDRQVESWSRLLIAQDAFSGRSRLSRAATGMPARRAACPRCGHYLEKDEKGRWRSRCGACREVLRACRSGRGPRRYALAEYVRRRMRSCFDCLIIDEAHEYRSAHSLQAEAAMALARTVPRLICLTGTLLGGYASHLYNVLYMLSPTFRREFDARQGGRSRFVQEYGLRVTERRPWQRKATSRPRPGVSPAVTPWLLERGVYLRLDEVVELPPLSEEALLVDPGGELGEAIRRLHQRARSRLQDINGTSRATAALMHALISYPDLAWAGEELMDPQSGELLLRYAPLAAEVLPKEQELISLVSREVAEGRPCLVYVTYTGTRDITWRLQQLLLQQGIRTEVLRAEEVPPSRRETWLMERMARGVQALICQPRLVALGLDLVTFPTVIFYQPDPDPFVLRQAARRSYRIGQSQPVHVYYMAYRGSAQELLLTLLARKTMASLLLEGEALGGGLLSVSQEDTLAELARLVREGGAEDAREAIRQQSAIARWSDIRPGWNGVVVRSPVLSSMGLQLSLPGL